MNQSLGPFWHVSHLSGRLCQTITAFDLHVKIVSVTSNISFQQSTSPTSSDSPSHTKAVSRRDRSPIYAPPKCALPRTIWLPFAPHFCNFLSTFSLSLSFLSFLVFYYSNRLTAFTHYDISITETENDILSQHRRWRHRFERDVLAKPNNTLNNTRTPSMAFSHFISAISLE